MRTDDAQAGTPPVAECCGGRQLKAEMNDLRRRAGDLHIALTAIRQLCAEACTPGPEGGIVEQAIWPSVVLAAMTEQLPGRPSTLGLPPRPWRSP